MDCFWFACDDTSAWSLWGRWVLVVCLIIVLIILFVLIFKLSSRRLQQGRAPIAGTGWLVQTQERMTSRGHGNESDVDPVPPYLPEVGDHDAGYYDANGQFVAKGLPTYEENVEYPPKAAVSRTRSSPDEVDPVELEYLSARSSTRPNDSPV